MKIYAVEQSIPKKPERIAKNIPAGKKHKSVAMLPKIMEIIPSTFNVLFKIV